MRNIGDIAFVFWIKSSTKDNHPITHKQGVHTMKIEYRFHHIDLFKPKALKTSSNSMLQQVSIIYFHYEPVFSNIEESS